MHVPLQQVAIADLLQFAALVIERPEEFSSQRIPVASDQLSAVVAARVLSRVAGRELEAEQTPADSVGPGLRALFDWLERVRHDVDIRALHRRYPSVRWHSYADWARSQAVRFRELCPREHAPAGAD